MIIPIQPEPAWNLPLQGSQLRLIQIMVAIAVFHGLIVALTFDPRKSSKTRGGGRGSKLTRSKHYRHCLRRHFPSSQSSTGFPFFVNRGGFPFTARIVSGEYLSFALCVSIKACASSIFPSLTNVMKSPNSLGIIASLASIPLASPQILGATSSTRCFDNIACYDY